MQTVCADKKDACTTLKDVYTTKKVVCALLKVVCAGQCGVYYGTKGVSERGRNHFPNSNLCDCGRRFAAPRLG